MYILITKRTGKESPANDMAHPFQVLVIKARFHCRQADPASPAASTSYLHADAEAMPLESRSQDMVAASYLLHEMPVVGIQGFLREVRRVLKPGGVIAVVDADPW